MRVYPTTGIALIIKHPHSPFVLTHEGVDWPDDGFTARMLSDGEITLEGGKGWKPEAFKSTPVLKDATVAKDKP